MNKKINFVLVLLLGSAVAFAQQYGDAAKKVELPKDSLGIHPWNGHENDTHFIIPDASHWATYLGLGFNVFDGDYTSEKKHGVWIPTVSLGGAYHWNNTWGTGVEYKYRNYRVLGSGLDRDADIMLKGVSHQAWGYVSFDLFNFFRPQNKKKLFALDVIVGGGAVWKKNSIYYPNTYKTDIRRDFPFSMTTATDQAMADDKFKPFGVFVGGLSAEFNINRSFQIGLRGLYNYSTTDEIDGRPVRGQNNDAFFDCEAIVRYKFEPRQKSNVRNFMVPQIENWNNGTYFEDPAIGAAKRAKYILTPNTDTVFNITRDTVWMMPPALANAAEETHKGIRNYVVFFENDVPELDNTALSITGEAAMLLNRETEYKAVVVGSCDNTGAVDYNKWLATQRAINVTETLAGMGVDKDRIYMVGRGIMQDDREEGSYSLNRRVEIHIVTDEGLAREKDELSFFERYKNVKRGSAVRQPGEGKNASSSSALKDAIIRMKKGEVIEDLQPVEKVAQPKAEPATNRAAVEEAVEKVAQNAEPVEVLELIIVPQDATLAILAKQYYGNPKLWTKIFEANRDRMTSPDQLRAGMELVIPKIK